MPANLNPHVVDLLAWHGHSAGGVHVPFQQRPNPVGQVIETALVLRLRRLATEIAAHAESRPRWMFLVGGPGNGKSETVQDFLSHLDAGLGAGGGLVDALRQRFTGAGLLPRKVEIRAGDLASGSTEFAAKVGRLIVVQDATATETATGNAAAELADDVADLFTTPPTPPVPVFIACANRGLLARAMNEAVRMYQPGNAVRNILAAVIQASSLGHETLTRRKRCWPLETDDRFACWPLDVESLLARDQGPGPLDLILQRAVEATNWEAHVSRRRLAPGYALHRAVARVRRHVCVSAAWGWMAVLLRRAGLHGPGHAVRWARSARGRWKRREIEFVVSIGNHGDHNEQDEEVQQSVAGQSLCTDTETSGDGPKVGECVGVYELVRIVRLEVKTEITEHPAK